MFEGTLLRALLFNYKTVSVRTKAAAAVGLSAFVSVFFGSGSGSVIAID